MFVIVFKNMLKRKDEDNSDKSLHLKYIKIFYIYFLFILILICILRIDANQLENYFSHNIMCITIHN